MKVDFIKMMKNMVSGNFSTQKKDYNKDYGLKMVKKMEIVISMIHLIIKYLDNFQILMSISKR